MMENNHKARTWNKSPWLLLISLSEAPRTASSPGIVLTKSESGLDYRGGHSMSYPLGLLPTLCPARCSNPTYFKCCFLLLLLSIFK